MPFNDVIQKFYDQLVAAGIKEESAAFTSGKFSSAVLEEVMQHVQDTLGEEKLAELDKLEPEEQAKQIESLYQEKTGMTVAEYRDQLADKKFEEFEAA